jgi:hypothetical protein
MGMAKSSYALLSARNVPSAFTGALCTAQQKYCCMLRNLLPACCAMRRKQKTKGSKTKGSGLPLAKTKGSGLPLVHGLDKKTKGSGLPLVHGLDNAGQVCA